MRTRVIVFLAFLCAALPLYAGEDQSDNSSSGATLTLETDNPEVISSFSWGIGAALRSDQGGGGAVFKELTLTKILSNSSKKLFEHCAAGTHFKEVVIHISRKGNAASANRFSGKYVAVGPDAFSEKASQSCPYEWTIEVALSLECRRRWIGRVSR